MDIHDFYAANAAKGQAAMRRKEAEGERMHLAPLGWRNARDAQGRSVMKPDPDTYPLMAEALGMRGRGESIRTVCRVMRQRGLRSKRGKAVGSSGMHRAFHSQPLDGCLCVRAVSEWSQLNITDFR